MKTITLKVVGGNTLHCGGCESSVRFVLFTLAGVHHVEADHRTQCIQVTHDETQVGQPEIVAELAHLGYRVEALAC